MQKRAKISADLGEELSSVPLVVRGIVPHWLSGTLVRNGPVNVYVDGQSNAHWFDGLAMLHAFTFDKGSVSYSNQFLRTEAYKTVFEEGSIHYAGFASDPCRSLFKRLFTWIAPKSEYTLPNANVNVAQIAQEYVALTETPLPVRFDPKTLKTLGVLEYEDQLPKEKCWESAHPHRIDNGILNYLIQYGRISHYLLYSVSDTPCAREVIARIPAVEPAYMHSFAMTENYVVFTEFPFVVKPIDFLKKGKPFIHNFVWKPERGTRFTVINKNHGGLIGSYTTKPFFAFHHANAFEKEGALYLDIICYDDPSIITTVADYFRTVSEEHDRSTMRLERFKLTFDNKPITSTLLLEAAIEFPRINSAYDGKPYRYLYLADIRDRVSPSDGQRPLYKVNTETKQTLTWSEKGCYPGEPLFVASPESNQEDEGVVLSLVLKPEQNTSFLLILDGQNFLEIGRAVAPHPIPPGLHGQFF
jgi:beta,beta-carotene 9',10'-dioxygenase